MADQGTAGSGWTGPAAEAAAEAAPDSDVGLAAVGVADSAVAAAEVADLHPVPPYL